MIIKSFLVCCKPTNPSLDCVTNTKAANTYVAATDACLSKTILRNFNQMRVYNQYYKVTN